MCVCVCVYACGRGSNDACVMCLMCNGFDVYAFQFRRVCVSA